MDMPGVCTPLFALAYEEKIWFLFPILSVAGHNSRCVGLLLFASFSASKEEMELIIPSIAKDYNM